MDFKRYFGNCDITNDIIDETQRMRRGKSQESATETYDHIDQ